MTPFPASSGRANGFGPKRPFIKGSSSSTYQRTAKTAEEQELEEQEGVQRRFEEVAERDALDEQLGFPRFSVGPPQVGWMTNMRVTLIRDSEWPAGRSAIDYYFLQDDGERFKATLPYSPYFFVKCAPGRESEVEEQLRKRFSGTIESLKRVLKEDLEMQNHVSGRRAIYLQLGFRSTGDLLKVRKFLAPIAEKSGGVLKSGDSAAIAALQGLSAVVDLREHDVPYHLRVAIDMDLRCGLWYTVTVAGQSNVRMERVKGRDARPDPVVLAFDIETSKKPLKFPDASDDPIMMISYMIDGRGFLITNRQIVSSDLDDFEYTPIPEFRGAFRVANEVDERAMLSRFFSHIQLVRPLIFVSYNGDQFDWPYIEKRAQILGLDMAALIGVAKSGAAADEQYTAPYATHMDCFCWVKRDSYLPAGSQGLKAVAAAKLGYNPLELDPEEMTPLAQSDPQTLANYSVSDAVATYYLYAKYVHPFIYSLCNLIPLSPDEVLRKGSGTLCETLLMAEAFKVDVIYPNKHEAAKERFWNGHLLAGETYVGGHVEACEAGVFRADLQYRFRLAPQAFDQLIADLDRALQFCVNQEGGVKVEDIENYAAVRDDIKQRLESLRDDPDRLDRPLIYHLDVGAMYPNIILTNRLQPPAIVTESACAVCDYNVPGKTCQRPMTWAWRGEYYTANRGEYRMIRQQLERERFTVKRSPRPLAYHELSEVEQTTLLEKRLAEYSQKVYRRAKQSETVERTSIVCMRENAFYIDTVRSFRDHRYTYKSLCKTWKRRLDEAAKAGTDPAAIEEADKMHTVYDSLQLAHKCILNSFYGYVMRKGARWYSMEMGGIVCQTGASIIKLATRLVEQVGKPLELDTDGIWCMLPWEFPQNYVMEVRGGKKKIPVAYPCVMLNHLVHDQFTNHQYQTLQDRPTHTFSQTSENSIFFEIDGPYQAMILPSSTEEGRQLKKRYAVFKRDGTLAELKGFEVKRRGELKLVKIFQTQLFETFLAGTTLSECYAAVAEVANYWLDVLDSQGIHLPDHDLFDLLSENRSMSKGLEEYGEQKSTSISTARRLAEFLGAQVSMGKGGLACHFIISRQPAGDPVNTRAIPVAIFSADPPVKAAFLRQWLRDPQRTDFDIRDILDWQYYRERFASVVQKLILIPAAQQGLPNPVPRVAPPDWLARKITAATSRFKQTLITDMFKIREEVDIEEAVGTRENIESNINSSSIAKSNNPTPTPCPDMMTDYGGWVAWQKEHRWGALNCKNSTKEKTQAPRPPQSWQIVNVWEERPGEFRCMLWSPSVAQATVTVTMKRTIYVHCHEPIDNEDDHHNKHLTRSHAKLPHTTRRHLYAVTAAEPDFQAMLPSLSSMFAHPNVEGVYEKDLPLSYLLACRLGCALRGEGGTLKRKLSLEEDIETAGSLLSTDYLSCAKWAFLGSWASDNRAVCILLPSSGSVASIFVVDPHMKRQLAAAKSIFDTLLNGQSGDEKAFPMRSWDFEVNYYPDSVLMQRSLQKSLSGLDASTLTIGNMDVVSVPVESGLTGNSLPALDWQRVGFRGLCEWFGEMRAELDSWLAVARYAQLPLGLVVAHRNTLSSYLSDVFFGRILRQHGYVFVSRKDDILLTADTGAAGNDTLTFSQPGVYPRCTVRIELAAFALNAVLEATSGLITEDAELEHQSPVFSLLKGMLTGWAREALQHGNPAAQRLLCAFHKWLGESSIMPSSWSRAIRHCLSRAGRMLRERVERLGGLVVYASPHELIMETPRDSPANADAFARYVLSELQAGAFPWLRMSVGGIWRCLAWFGPHDMAAVAVSGDEGLQMEMKLSIEALLPEPLRKPLQQTIAAYLLDRVEGKRRDGDNDEGLLNLVNGVFTEKDGGRNLNEEDELDEDIGLACKQRIINAIMAVHRVSPSLKSPSGVLGVTRTTLDIDLAFSFARLLYAFLATGSEQKEGARHSALFKLIDKALRLVSCPHSTYSPAFTITTHPIQSVMVRDYACPGCCAVYDVDLARDSSALLESKTCLQCPHQLDFEHVEACLIKQWSDWCSVMGCSVDWSCQKCGDVRVGWMRRSCRKCPGKYEPAHLMNDVPQKDILMAVCHAYGFRLFGAILTQ